MINTWKDFEDTFNNVFGRINTTSLASIDRNRLRIELGGEGDDSARVIQAIQRSNRILEYCFSGKDVWIRAILWSEDEEAALEMAGLSVRSANKLFRQKKEDEEVLYLFFDRYTDSLGKVLTTSIINYEMALEPSANITCYFINLKDQLIINIYDDRGMDIFSPNDDLIYAIGRQFSGWLLK
ncbi:DUF3885 domain-containing protein [Pararcticibacter amylolyticus]|uniref:DUF3885 domain-containing protein n=1 Tax=Pararcticibacter amylolyticus TaxID=2173175 RepID=A0A2U2P9W0_9SPHI|nr:DUF3885 domain-containing protein [Pararcticibacter amylolyticus]PWG78084.1 hypothetical protein DDR33_24005 [Pararcticibacter amylolyticus]